MIKKYVSRQLDIDAVQITVENINRVADWCGGSVKGTKLPPVDRVIDVQTANGEQRASIGDYMLHGYGEFYPCPDHVFELKYCEV